MGSDAAVSAPGESVRKLIEAASAAEAEGSWDEAIDGYEAALWRLRGDTGDAVRAAELLQWIGRVHRQRGDLELAREIYRLSLTIAEANGLDRETAAALNCVAIAEQFQNGIAAAEPLYTRARQMAEAADDVRLTAKIDQNLGTLANMRGDIDAALRRYESALPRFRELGDHLAAAWVLNNMGMANVDLGRWAAAERAFDEAFELADREHDTNTLASIELNRAELHLKRTEHEPARECCDRAFEIFSRVGSTSGIAEACKFYGILYRDTSKPHLAFSHLQDAVELAATAGDRLLEAEAQRELATLHLDAGDNRDALQSLTRAHQLFGELAARQEIVDLDRRLDRLEAMFLRVVSAWAESIESQDRYTAGHCERVADYACRLAETQGITGRDLVWFRMGALLHDVGKLAVPAEVLNKPGELTPEEWALVRDHTKVGDEIVAELNFPWDIRPIVRSHHEHWDGTGYPDGLAGDDIPLAARILRVADVFDALTSDRSYQSALSPSGALSIMEEDAGTTLDPDLVAVFARCCTEGSSRSRAPGRLRLTQRLADASLARGTIDAVRRPWYTPAEGGAHGTDPLDDAAARH